MENNKIQSESLVSFTKKLSYFEDENYSITKREPYGEDDCYTLQVEVTNNYCILLNDSKGLVVKNCGDVIKIQIKVDEHDKIVDSKCKIFGCGSAIANTSFASELIKGKTLTEASSITNMDIAKATHSNQIKLHCSSLAADAIKAAVDDIKKKRESN